MLKNRIQQKSLRFKVKENNRFASEKYNLNLGTPEWNQVTFGANSSKAQGQKI